MFVSSFPFLFAGLMMFTLLMIGQCNAVKIDAKQCGGQINDVQVIGCEEDKQPCRISRGTKPKLTVEFVSPFQARFVRADVRGKLEGTDRIPVYIPWAGLHRNACDGHGLSCPLKRSTKYVYNYEMPVGLSTPTFKTEYTWKLTNAWGFTIACFSMPLEIY